MGDLHDHRWTADRTALCPPAIGVSCPCGAKGGVVDFTPEEWRRAYFAAAAPYHWPDGGRVQLPTEADR